MEAPGEKVKEILHDALERPAAERDAFIERACAGDAAQAGDVRRLLRAHDAAGAFMSEPSMDGDTTAAGELEEEVPESIGGRRILGKLGEGGFGVVYLAQQERPVRMEVAVKVVRPGMGSQKVLSRFEMERRALELMKHPNIAGVIDAGSTDDGRPYFVLEHVPGEPITSYVRRNQLSIGARLELFEQVCLGVQHAHQKGVIHRDLKPSNVMVTEIDGRPVPKVIDFGIAKAVQGPLSERTVITQSAQIVGTPQYMSPEQVSFGEIDVDTRSDVYSLGALLYETLTGVPPFEPQRINRAGAAELERIIREEEPPRPSTRVMRSASESGGNAHVARELRGDLDWIVARAMEKDRNRRYQTPYALAADLRRYLSGDPVEAGPPSGLYRLRKMVSRHRVEFSAASAVAIALVAVVVVSLIFATRAETARDRAETELAKFRAISTFTEEMLSGIDPAVARGADTALFRSILDDAAARVSEEGAGMPEVEVELRAMIGLAYRSVALYDEAEEQLIAAMATARERLGADDPLTLEVESAYGQILGETNRLEEALTLFRSVHERRAVILGQDDAQTIEALSNVGAVLNELGRYAEAAEVHEEALRRRIRVLGDDHEQTMATRNNLATAVGDLGRLDEAVVLLERVLDHQIQTSGEDHPRTLATMNNLAFSHDQMGNHGTAESLFRRVLEIKQRVLPEGHPSTIITMNNLASILGASGQPERAIEILQKAHALSTTHAGTSDMRTLTIQNNLASNLIRADRLSEAEPLLREAAEEILALAGPSHPNSIAVRSQLASLLNELGRHEEALGISAELVEQGGVSLPPDHRILARVHLAHGDALAALNRPEEAEKSLLEAHRVASANFPPESDRMRAFLESIRDFYRSQANAEELARWEGAVAGHKESAKKN